MTTRDRKLALLERMKRELPSESERVMRDLLGIRSVQVVPVQRPEVDREQ